MNQWIIPFKRNNDTANTSVNQVLSVIILRDADIKGQLGGSVS